MKPRSSSGWPACLPARPPSKVVDYGLVGGPRVSVVLDTVGVPAFHPGPYEQATALAIRVMPDLGIDVPQLVIALPEQPLHVDAGHERRRRYGRRFPLQHAQADGGRNGNAGPECVPQGGHYIRRRVAALGAEGEDEVWKDVRLERVGERALGALTSNVVLESPEEVRAFEKRRRLQPVQKARGILCVNVS